MKGPRSNEDERRREARVSPMDMLARSRLGYHLVLIDLSAAGALVEAGRPLRPGSHIDVHLESDARRKLVAARVLRCTVAAIDPQSGVTYRAALAFIESSEWIRETLTQRG